MNTFIKGQFEFPKGTKLASAVHGISVFQPLAEPQRLKIQHCVNLKTQAQANCLHFVRAPSSTTILPNQFTLVKGGQFNPGSQYGVIDMTCESSCLVAIVADREQQSQKTNEESSLATILSVYLIEVKRQHFFVRSDDKGGGDEGF